ncbi:PAN domain-containing protein [Rhodocyclus purpureus]|uniref:PAN domain-containing protein n=1 Tax=Rhodocyclus purpureus TaxID=1067 RepID=UPI001913416F|nr:PAN domain-containing protein [Rhodocyclus purpureus]MBK5914636.1 hypothetical protein [Rhodocyclus purpureus]
MPRSWIMLLASLLVIASPLPAAADPVLTVESNTDRAGLDYQNFELSSARPDLCLAACAKDARCQAYTYVKPAVQGAKARCWLKQGKPTTSANSCCVSGVKTAKTVVSSASGKDRPGSDYSSFNLPSASPDLCLAACAKQASCKAWTYVKPGVQGASARCWLKNNVPAETASTCCTSGTKQNSLEQARSYAITKWDGNCSGSQRDWWDDMCMAWRHRMGAKGWDQWWNNFSLVQNPKFADPQEETWGADNGSSGWDRGEAALICTHGGHGAATGWSGSMHTDVGHGCKINTNQILAGPASGGHLRFLHLSSCNSMNWDELDKWWMPAGGRVHLVTGFHGFMYIGGRYVDEYEDLANDGFSSGVGNNWIHKMHHVDHWYNAWETVCPIVIGFGETAAAATNAVNEKYNDRWADQAPVWRHVVWWSKCDPDGAGQLPE